MLFNYYCKHCKSEPEISNWSEEDSTLHLCEAPGNFIGALNYFLAIYHANVQWDWKANSLNPHYEYTNTADMMLADDLIVSHPQNWLFGKDNSGNILTMAKDYEIDQEMDLVTADGSCFCQDKPELQEETVYDIIQAEVYLSLCSLVPHGSMIVKIYTTHTKKTTRLVILLERCFDELVMCKPSSSKAGNSERYLIGIGYRNPDWLMSSLRKQGLAGFSWILKTLKPSVAEYKKLLSCAEYFAELQIAAIEANIREFRKPTISKEALEIARSKCVSMAVHVMRANLLPNAKNGSFELVFDDNYVDNPWKKQQAANYIEELRLLRNEEHAREFIREKQRDKCMKFGKFRNEKARRTPAISAREGRNMEDEEENFMEEIPIEVEWAPEELTWIQSFLPPFVEQSSYESPPLSPGAVRSILNTPPLIFVPRNSIPSPSISHSLFVDIRLMHAIRTLAPRREFMVEDLVLNIPVEFTRGKRAWFKVLDRIVNQGDPPEVVRWLLSVSEPAKKHGNTVESPKVLLLSRFSVSVLTVLSIVYTSMQFFHPESGKIVEFSKPNYREDVPPSLGFLVHTLYQMTLKEGESMEERSLSFVPVKFFADLHGVVSTFNRRQLDIIWEHLRL